jgi:hypothetical protein
MRVEPETEHQDKMYAWIVDMKDGRKERAACQEEMEANPEKMEPNPGEKEVVVERQEISKGPQFTPRGHAKKRGRRARKRRRPIWRWSQLIAQ